MIMKNDVEITTVKAKHPHKGDTHIHPCFGKISVNRITGRANLFATSIENSSFMSVTISECEVTQDLGRNWYMPKKEIVEAWLSPVQYAELISSPNTSGVPCTIRYRTDLGHITPRSIDTITQFAKSELEKSADSIRMKAAKIADEVNEILSKKGSLTKVDRGEIYGLVASLSTDVKSNFKFYEENVHKGIEKAAQEAKAEIDHHINHAITKLGVETLSSPEAMKLLLRSNETNKCFECEGGEMIGDINKKCNKCGNTIPF
jgi:hypothetical protein